MINMGQEFINLMRNTNGQVVSARLNILNSPEVTNLGFLTNSIEQYLLDNNYATIKSGSEYWIRQMNNCITNETAQYSIFENDGIPLDGSIKLLSKTAKYNEMGWLSSSLSNSIGVFSTYPYLQWNYGIGAQSNFNIVFSKTRNEYAVDFDIIFEQYSDDPVLDPSPDPVTYSVIGNTSTAYTLSNVPISMNGGSSLKVIIKKWSAVNARAKITDLYFGEMLIYTDEDIVSIDGNKQVDLTNKDIPSKQISFTIQDVNGDYNIFNPQGGLANLNKASRVALELGPVTTNGDVLFCKIDEYILGKPKKEKNSLEVSLTGYGRLNTLSNKKFAMNFYDKQTAEFLTGIYGQYINNSHMGVDDTIKSEGATIRTQYPEDTYLTDGLRKIATAVRGNIVETVDNDMLITRIIENIPVANIALDNMLDIPEIQVIDIPKSVDIKTYYPVATTMPIEVFRLDYNIWNKPDIIAFNYSKDHTAGPYTAYLKLNSTGVEAQFYPYFMDNKALHQVTDIDNNITNITVRINANVVDIQSSSFKYIIDNNNTEEINLDNESIDTYSMATNIFNWLLENINKQFEYKVEIQDTCTYALGDTVSLETNVYVNDVQVVRNAIITGIDFKYAGSLHYYLTLKGA